MTDAREASIEQGFVVRVAVGDHRLRAQIAMSVAEFGGHAETYEDLSELVAAKPDGGTALVASELGSAAQILSQFQANGVFLPLILFAQSPSPSQIVKAVHDGAAHYLSWPFTGEDLLASCAYCLKFMEQEGGRITRQRQARQLIENLTNRERQILAFMVDGHSNKSMARTLALSPRTIEDYRLSTMKKLGVEAASAAIRLGLEAGLQSQLASAGPEPQQIVIPLR